MFLITKRGVFIMPIYEFSCLDCGKNFEKLIFNKEEEKKIKCPYCGSQNIQKLLSGFYSNKPTSLRSSSCSSKGFGFT